MPRKIAPWPLIVAISLPLCAEPSRWCLDEVLRRVPPLTHDATGRWPLVIWENFPVQPGDGSYSQGKPLPAESYRELARRGLAEHIRLDPRFIEMAKAIQSAGSRVIVVQGSGGPGPYALAGDAKVWAHQLPADYKPKERVMACPLLIEGWARHADQLRATLRQFREAGVTLDAAWLDYEGDPLYWGDAFEQVSRCGRCQSMVPRHLLSDRATYLSFAGQWQHELVGAYYAGPIREAFPNCSVTNWEAVYSTPQRPAYIWHDKPRGTMLPPLFTATNPIAYGNTDSFRIYMPDDYARIREDRNHRVDGSVVDRLYTHVLLRGVSADAANMQSLGIRKQSIPWVCRWCPDDETPGTPLMSRSSYREVLRHLWLRGADGMQIFNPVRRLPDADELILGEVEDAVAVYDEMLAFREFLESGEVMNTAVPGLKETGPVWSGLRLSDRALVRVFAQGDPGASISITPWPGMEVRLDAVPEGRTTILALRAGGVAVEIVPRAPRTTDPEER